MNLRVDLILDTEKRSASPVTLKSIIRIVSITIPTILIIVFAMAYIKGRTLQSERDRLKNEIDITKPKKVAATKLRQELLQNFAYLKELETWGAAHTEWHNHLRNIQKEVPSRIQLENMTLSQVLELKKGKPARVFSIIIKGKAIGRDAEDNIQKFYDKLVNDSSLSPLIKESKVRGNADNRKGALKTDRIFTIECFFHPRKFE